MQLSYVRLLVVYALVRASQSYSDVRATPCMSEKLIEIAANKGVWGGGIEMTMECDEDYDLPLNAPMDGRFQCVPDRSPWMPSFVPDCNKLSKPIDDKGYALVSITTSSCASVKAQEGGSTIDVGVTPFAPSVVCTKDTGFEGCSLFKVIPACEGALEGKNEHEHWVNEVKPATGGHVVVILNVDFGKKDIGALYDGLKGIVMQMAARVPTGIDFANWKAISRLKPACPNATIGAMKDNMPVCRGCSLGHKLDYATKSCLPCEPGYYQDNPLSMDCKLCPALTHLAIDSKLWKEMDKHASNRSFSIIYCPSIAPNGSLVAAGKTIGGQDTLSKVPAKDARAKDGATMGPRLAMSALCLMVFLWLL